MRRSFAKPSVLSSLLVPHDRMTLTGQISLAKDRTNYKDRTHMKIEQNVAIVLKQFNDRSWDRIKIILEIALRSVLYRDRI